MELNSSKKNLRISENLDIMNDISFLLINISIVVEEQYSDLRFISLIE